MKTYVVNLEHEKERRNEITSQCNVAGLDFELIEAVNGMQLNHTLISAVTYNYPNCGLTSGEIGCALSHLSIYSSMIANGIECALILEDDAFIQDDMTKLLIDIEQNISTSVPEVYLLTENCIYNPLVKNNSITNGNFFRLAYGSCTHGYILNRKAAEAVIKINLPLKFESDRWELFRNITKMNIWCLDKSVVTISRTAIQTSSLSTERLLLTKKRSAFLSALVKSNRFYQLKRLKNLIINKTGKKTNS